MSSFVGTMQLAYSGKRWQIQCQPHAAMMLKRLFPKINVNATPIELPADDETCRDLEWFCARYPLESKDTLTLFRRANAFEQKQGVIDKIINEGKVSREFNLAVPPRDYQKIAASWMVEVKRGLLADEVGLGKTCSAIATMAECGEVPIVVVCDTHLPRQWKRELNRFCPRLKVHIIKNTIPYDPTKEMIRGRLIKHPYPDVFIVTYSKLSSWARDLADTHKVQTVVFDECQGLRRSESEKYTGAVYLADRAERVYGLSATPIYNYGGEMYNIGRVIYGENVLGTKEEFFREWCTNYGEERKAQLKDPAAFGAWMRASHKMLRRTRKEVRREIPDLSVITHTVDSDPKYLQAVESQAGALARMILAETEAKKGDRMHAASEFSNTLRQASGLSKAPYVAAFVELLIENGENVVLSGWHHSVYQVWMDRLKDHNPVLYTGHESLTQKEESFRKFREGESKVFIISNRSGAGLDGLQYCCRTVVVGELDWSPMVLHQLIGRVHRDGQPDPVTAYFLVAEDGLDPIMEQVLNIKKFQSERMLTEGELQLEQRIDASAVIRKLAEQYAQKSFSRNRV
jgi:SNF2 family DNA or RNA helicase